MSEWEITRRQVAIAGKVTDGFTGRPVPGAKIAVTTPSGGMELTVEPDGHFHVLDLPDGPYDLEASMPGGFYEATIRQVTVERNPEGRILMAVADMQLARAV